MFLSTIRGSCPFCPVPQTLWSSEVVPWPAGDWLEQVLPYKAGLLHITDNKGLGEAPEPGLLADTLITALRPRQKGGYEFQVQGKILSRENQ